MNVLNYFMLIYKPTCLNWGEVIVSFKLSGVDWFTGVESEVLSAVGKCCANWLIAPVFSITLCKFSISIADDKSTTY